MNKNFFNRFVVPFFNIAFVLLLVFLFFRYVDIHDFLFALSNADFFLLFLSFALGFFALVIAAVNIWLFLKALDISIKPVSLFRYVTFSWALGSVAPGRLGEFGLSYILKHKEGLSYGPSLSVSILDKVVTVFVLLSLSFFGFYRFFGVGYFLVVAVFFIVGIAISLFLLLNERFRLFLKDKVLKARASQFSDFSRSLRTLLFRRKLFLLLNVFVTYIKWIYSFFLIHLIVLSLGIDISFFTVAVIFSFLTLVSILPISISGLGLSEVSGTALLYSLGVDPSVGVGVFLLNTAKKYLWSLLIYVFNSRLLKR